MHIVIINGSPRVEKYSNTDKIIGAFAKGLINQGVTCEKYAISDRNTWVDICHAYETNTQIMIALPLFVECVPGLLLEFLGTLPQKNMDTQISFILQGGFAEGSQFRCGEEFLKELPAYLGCSYGGCLVKGDNFSIRLLDADKQKRITKPYERMGEVFAKEHSFDNKECRDFTGPEYFSFFQRLMLGMIFRTLARKMFNDVAKVWGCTEKLDAKPYKI